MGIAILIAAVVIIVSAFGAILKKAGKPAWPAAVPVYGGMVLAEVAGRPAWHGLLLVVPFVNLVFGFMLMIDIAKSFGKSTSFGVGMMLLSFVFVPLLAWRGDPYLGPVYQR